MLPQNITIEELLPHRDGMLLIDEIVDLDEHQAVARATVSDQWPLADHLGVSSLLLIELAAQTAGINNGWQNRLHNGADADRRGWIVGIKSARFDVDRLSLGAVVTITAQNSFEFEGFREISATAAIADRTIAWISLQVMQAQEEKHPNSKEKP